MFAPLDPDPDPLTWLNPGPKHWFLDGQIQLILGPMFSGKSTELIRRLKRYEVAQYKVLIVKYAKVRIYFVLHHSHFCDWWAMID